MRLLKRLSDWLSKREAAKSATPGAPSPTTDRAVDSRTNTPLVRAAAAHMTEGRVTEAERVLSKALRERHDDAEALLLQGLLHKRQKRLEDATDSFLLAAHFEPDLAEPHYQLGLIAESRRESADAERYYRRADRKSTRLNSSHMSESRMPSSA